MIGKRINGLGLGGLFDELADVGGVDALLDLSLAEDGLAAGRGDLTSDLVAKTRGDDAGSPQRACRFDVVARESGVLAGLRAVERLAERFGGVSVERRAEDGDPIEPGRTVAALAGEAARVTAMERAALNLLGRLSGVATTTAAYVAASVAGGAARVCDTRKTTPGLRALEKYAVRCGGGWVHRLGLHDAVLIKDNHLAGLDAGAIGELVRTVAVAARPRLGPDGFVMVECDGLDQLDAVLRAAGGLIDAVLLDNMAPAALRSAVERRDRVAPGVELEASGGVRLDTIGVIAACGVDRISAGGLTRGAVWIDFGLDAAAG